MTGKDAPHHRGVSAKGRPQHREIVTGASPAGAELILDEFSHVQRCFLFACFVIRGLRSVSA